jgi:putative Ig domain-containing protein
MGTFVVIDNGAGFATSNDGATWAQGQFGTPFAQFWFSIAFGNGVFVVAGTPADFSVGAWWHSTDGNSWTPAITDTGVTPGNMFVIFDGLRFVTCIDQNGDGIVNLWTSTDGATWANAGSFNIGGSDNVLAFSNNGGSLYIAATANGAIFTSPDLSTWTSRTNPVGAFGFAAGVWWNGSLWMIVSQQDPITSPDGITWTAKGTIVADTTFCAVTFSNVYGGWIAGINFPTNSPAIFDSGDNGATWAGLYSVPGNGVQPGISLFIQGNDLYVLDQLGNIDRAVNGGSMNTVFTASPDMFVLQGITFGQGAVLVGARETQSAVEAITLLNGNGRVTQSVVETIVGLGISCGSPPAGNVGTVYAHTFPTGGGFPPYVFSIVAGSLPPGLNLNSATGVVSGTPSTPGTFPFTIQVNDSQGSVATADCSITITGGTGVTIILYGYKLMPVKQCGELVEAEDVPPVKRVL